MAFRDYILHNFWWKLLSLLLSALTWLTIETAFQKDQNLRESPVITSSRRSFSAVPITLVTLTSNTNQYKIDPPTASLEISGTDGDLAKLQLRDVKAFVDVTDAGDERQFRRDIQAQVHGDLKAVKVIPADARVEKITGPK